MRHNGAADIPLEVTLRPGAAAGRPRALRPDGRRSDILERGADQAVADAKLMIEERQRPIAAERREPQRQPRQLHGHGIDVHTVEALLRHQPPECRPARRR